MEPSCGDVQIKADLKEIRRRIEAFQARKRREVDELNLFEFCSRRPDVDLSTNGAEIDSCCRVDAVVVRRADSKGHIKVSRVENQWGPQTLVSRRMRQNLPNAPASAAADPSAPSTSRVVHNLPEGIEERINNMETHLSLGKPVPKDIYARLKSLEDRILYLESISPDYFTDQPSRKALKTEHGRMSVERGSDLSLDDIEARIRKLRGSLLLQNKTAS